MPTQRVHFNNPQGQQLAGLIDLPDGEPRAWALFSHCFTCSKHFKAIHGISRALAAEGYGVLRFDFTGLGESEGEFGDTNFSSNAADLEAAAKWLGNEHAPPRLLVGHSLGGSAVLHAAHSVDECRAVATIASPASPQQVLRHIESSREKIEQQGYAEVRLAGRPFTIKKQFLDDLEEASIDESIRTLDRALLVMHAPGDATVSIDNATRIFKTARHPKSFVSLDGMDHLLSEESASAYAGRVVAAWASRYL